MNSTNHVLVTGGAGYIGSHTVVELIEAGNKVTIVDNLERSEYKIIEGVETITGTKIDFHRIDCLDSEALSKLFSDNKFSSILRHSNRLMNLLLSRFLIIRIMWAR